MINRGKVEAEGEAGGRKVVTKKTVNKLTRAATFSQGTSKGKMRHGYSPIHNNKCPVAKSKRINHVCCDQASTVLPVRK